MLYRYCLQWHRIVQGRVNQEWWEKVLAPLEQLELAATNDSEDMELQTRALTEPLPTNQQVQPIQDLREINITYFTLLLPKLIVILIDYYLWNYLGLQRPSPICP